MSRIYPQSLTSSKQTRIPRACFYHLVYTGRGAGIVEDDLTAEETRAAFDLILDRSMDLHRRGIEKDILMVDNHCDGVYLYMRLLKEDPERAKQMYALLEANGGNASGVAIGCVDNLGNVHADQFWQSHTFGNVRERPFSEIWTDTSDPIMAGLKDRKPLLKGRCAQTNCRWIDVCNGNFRARAVAVYDDPVDAGPGVLSDGWGDSEIVISCQSSIIRQECLWATTLRRRAEGKAASYA